MRKLVILTGLFLSMSAFADTSQLKLDLLLAKRGDVSAQYSVATAYEFGTDIKKNLKQSFEWYMKAANQSHAPSQYKIGLFFEKGLGTIKNIDAALIWYNKAKANGSNQASKRLNKTAYEKSQKVKKSRRLASQAKLDKKERTQKTKKAVTIKIPDIMSVVLKNKWKNKHGGADYLPSVSTTCLESGNKELTCFSSEKSRKVKNSNVTYTAKSLITNFKSNGSFKVFYNYNGINTSIASKKTKSSDIYGLTMKKGWQEPGIAVKCQATNRKNITCFRGNKKVSFHR